MNRKNKTASLGFGIAACSVAVNADGEIQLTPAGQFRGVDGRPKDAPAWVMDAQAAQDVIAFCSARKNDLVIDYEHQTLHAENNGQPAPAAGWFSGAALRWVDGEGIFVKPSWTKRAQSFIDSEEYKYISPVILYEKITGRVKGIVAAALTNNACIDGMDEVLSRAAASFLLDETTTKEDSIVNELMERLCYLLNLPLTTTPEEMAAELDKLKGMIAGVGAASLTAYLDTQTTQIAALKSATPDLAKFVPVETMTELRNQVAALTSQLNGKEVDDLVEVALSSGKLLPAQESWARDLGKSNLAALTAYLDTAQPVAALSGTQTGGKEPDGETAGELTDSELAMCRSMGVDPEDFKKTKANQQGGNG